MTDKFEKIRLIVSDFDGVMTDNKVIVDEQGNESVICDRSDGLGIDLLKKKGIDIIVISKESNKVVKARCDKLKISCIRGVDKKLSTLKKEIKRRGLLPEEVCFIGNDINDIECIKYVGLGVAVNNAFASVKESADVTTKRNGGDGAVREIADKINGTI